MTARQVRALLAGSIAAALALGVDHGLGGGPLEPVEPRDDGRRGPWPPGFAKTMERFTAAQEGTGPRGMLGKAPTTDGKFCKRCGGKYGAAEHRDRCTCDRLHACLVDDGG